jgi:Cof subfamily protein (haloacid dehalogenase superfamily)
MAAMPVDGIQPENGVERDDGRGRIRLVATDLDGTLLAPDGSVSPRTLAAVRRLERDGVTLCLATARRWTGVLPVAQTLAMRGPLILYDGAIARDYPSGEVLLRDPLPPETARAAVALLAAYGLRPIVQYSTEEGERLLVAPPDVGSDAVGDGAARYLADQTGDQVRLAPLDELVTDADVLRVCAFAPVRHLRVVARDLAHLPCGRQLLKTGMFGTAELTLFAATASKGTALAAIAERLGCSLAETLAIGDGINDISMLRMAGTGVAMRHAPPSVQRAASHRAGTNAEEGVVEALEAHVWGTAGR